MLKAQNRELTKNVFIKAYGWSLQIVIQEVEKAVEVEKIVYRDVPVEKIVYVDKIVEKTVERIVEKIVHLPVVKEPGRQYIQFLHKRVS